MLTLASGGHSDAVLAVNVVDDQSFVSCSKDQTVCLWNIDEKGSVKLIAKGGGHSSFVGAVGSSAKFIFSASKDGILKVNTQRFLLYAMLEYFLKFVWQNTRKRKRDCFGLQNNLRFHNGKTISQIMGLEFSPYL